MQEVRLQDLVVVEEDEGGILGGIEIVIGIGMEIDVCPHREEGQIHHHLVEAVDGAEVVVGEVERGLVHDRGLGHGQGHHHLRGGEILDMIDRCVLLERISCFLTCMQAQC